MALVGSLNWVLAANAIAGVLNLVGNIWFARLLGPLGVGQYADVLTVVQVATAFFSAGFDQFLISRKDREKFVGAACALTIVQVVAIVTSALLYLFLQDGVGGWTDIRLQMALALLGQVILSLWYYLLAVDYSARQQYKFLSLLRLASVAIGLFASMVWANVVGDAFSLVIRDVIAAVVLVLGVIGVRRELNLSNVSLDSVLEVWRFARALWSLNVAERLVLRGDYLLVSMYLGSEALGKYFVVRGLVEGVLGFLLNPIQTVLFTHLCQVGSGGLVRHNRSVGWVFLLYLVVSVLISISFVPVAGAILGFVVGEDYADISDLVPLLLLYCLCTLWFEGVKVAAMAYHLHQPMVLARLAQLLVIVLATVPLLLAFGVVGSGVGTAFASVVLCIVGNVVFRRQMQVLAKR